MKRIKILITLLISLLIIFGIHNVCFAESYYDADERAAMIQALNEFKEANKGVNAIGHKLMLAYSSLLEGEHLYCISHGQHLENPAEFKVVKYIQLNGVSASIPGTNLETQNNYNAIMGQILSGRYGTEWGSKPDGSLVIHDVQKALWTYWSAWLDDDFWNRTPGQGATTNSREYFGFDSSWGSKPYEFEDVWSGILNDLMNEVLAAYNDGTLDTWNTKVDLYFLEATAPIEYYRGEAWSQPKPFQKLIIAIPHSGENPDLQIIKVDAKTGKNLKDVTFTVKSNTLGKYISKVTDEGNNTFKVTGYSATEADAVKFTTGEDTYRDIIIKELPEGEYTIKEVDNGNSGYEKNIGKEWIASVKSNGSNICKIKIKNGEEGEDTPPPTPPTPPPTAKPYSGEATISGTIWEDSIDASKNNIGNHLLDSGEKGIEGVRVIWYTTYGGHKKLASGYTNSNGYYSLSYKIPMKTCNYYESSEERYALQEVNNSYLVFEYNGLKYTTVATNIGLSNGSKAKENTNDRSAIDNAFDEVTGKGVMNGNYKAYDISYIRNQMHTSSLNATNSDFAVSASTQNLCVNLLDNYCYETSSWICTNHCFGNGSHCMNPSDNNFKTCAEMGCTTIVEKEDGSTSEEPVDHGGHSWHTHFEYCKAEHCGGDRCGYNKSDYYDEITTGWHIEDMNLGLIKKEQVQVGLTSDIEEVKIISRGQAYTYKYNYREQLTDGQLYDYKVKFEDKDIPQTYRRPVNPADVAMVEQNTKDIEIYVTYKIKAKNLSNTLTLYVQEILNYYDAGYSLSAESDKNGWSTTSKYGHTSQYLNQNEQYGRFGAAYYQLNQKLAPQTESTVVKVTYKVSQETIKKLIINKEAPLNNISEICSYSTFYGTDTICAEYKTAEQIGFDGKQYASIDEVAIPENAVPGNKTTYERDTDMAPTFLLEHDEYKMISGTVWEDLQTKQSERENERLGNGIKDNGEKGVANVKVELLRVDENGTIVEPAKLYNIENQRVDEILAVTYTDENGNYTFGSNEIGAKKGVAVDRYVIRYTYGNKVQDESGNTILANGATKINDYTINARDYKSTIIVTDLMKENINKTQLNNGEIKLTNYTEENSQWHLKTRDSSSSAIDDIGERLKIESLKYSNFDTGVNISAYSAVFGIQVEYTQQQLQQVNVEGEPLIQNEYGDIFEENFVYDYSTFDFGIIKRPQEDIVAETIISNLKIVLADGQILTEGNPYTQRMQYVKAVGDKSIKTREDVRRSREKLVSLEIDQELIQGARIDVLYTTTVTNNSENDYEYSLENNKYYYFGDKQGLELINTSVEKLVNYLDGELVLNEDEAINKIWTSISAQELLDQGYISENTFKAVKDNYTMFITDRFTNIKPGQYHKEQLAASKLLANQATEYTYENHVEIIQLNSKIARTTETNDAERQIAKTYKVGNYIPSLTKRTYNANLGSAEILGLHQQDDDMIKITITPPTGSSNNTITYITIITIGMIVLVGGIIFIKKKVL